MKFSHVKLTNGQIGWTLESPDGTFEFIDVEKGTDYGYKFYMSDEAAHGKPQTALMYIFDNHKESLRIIHQQDIERVLS